MLDNFVIDYNSQTVLGARVTIAVQRQQNRILVGLPYFSETVREKKQSKWHQLRHYSD